MTADFAARITDILTEHTPMTKRRKSELRTDVDYNDPACTGCDWSGRGFLAEAHRGHHATLIAAAAEEHYRPRITTQDELDALPAGSVVGVPLGTGLMIYELAYWGEGDGSEWSTDGMPDPNFNAADLPAVLLWSPGADDE